jgi:group I intron endonuclease
MPKTDGIVYRITNIRNGKVYVGKTNGTIARRWTRHVAEAKRGTNTRLYNAMRKYGVQAFEISPIETVLFSGLSDAEREWIQKLKSRDPKLGYNITPGGDGAGVGPDNPNYGKPGPNRGRKFPPEFGQKISQAKKGTKVSEQARQNIIRGLTGRIPTEATRQKLAQGKRGALNPSWKKPHSAAWKRQNSERFRDRVWISLGTSETKRVKSSELQEYFEKGWIQGRWNRRARMQSR